MVDDKDLDEMKSYLEKIRKLGWMETHRKGNCGGAGNTLEDLFDVKENNQQLPDYGKWELKSHRLESTSLLTLFHMEPQPRSAKIVPTILLPKYGWPHDKAGIDYPENEKSFRQTINATGTSDRGFMVDVDKETHLIAVVFDFSKIGERHSQWRNFVQNGVGTGQLSPIPYWTFDSVERAIFDKMTNMLFASVQTKHVGQEQLFKYDSFEVFMDPTLDRFISLLEQGDIYVDFDARTGHNHGTKFRIKQSKKTDLYQVHFTV